MKKLNILLLGLLIAFLFVNTSCKKDEEEKVNESEVLAEYLETTDFVNTYMPTIMPASDVNSLNLTNQIYIIDIRSAEDFAKGYIKNAHNVALVDIVTHIKSVDLSNFSKVVIVCYTGQTAGYAASILRFMGYDKVFSMKWGMSSWHEDFAGKWNGAIGNGYASQFVSTPSTKNATGDLPVLSTGKTSGEDILEARVVTLLNEGFGVASISNQALFASLEANYIINYWPANHYEIGHIPGAAQYTPKESIKLSADLKTLPTNKPVVVYCYTGQTSAYLTAYLRLLGYDAKSLLYGSNAMIYDIMVENSMTTFGAEQIMGYEYEK